MASTSPFPENKNQAEVAREYYGAARRLFGTRAQRPRHGGRAQRRAALKQQARKQRKEAISNGLPHWQGLKPVLLFLLLPTAIVVGIVVTGGHWPKPLLYGIALIMGVWVAHSTLRSPELVLACALFYLPFSSSYVIPLAPGINGTNVLMLMALFASINRSLQTRESWFAWHPGANMVFGFAVLSSASGITSMLGPSGYTNLLYNELLSYKGWMDQFVFYFIALSCVRDKEMAKRMVVYMLIGSIVLVMYSVPEMLDKMGRSTIEKSRIEGPHKQSNNFGGFVAYTILPLVSLFMVFIKDIRAWIFTQILITTFSRGAYVALALGGMIAAYLKGRSFVFSWASLVIVAVLIFPQIIPTAITDRLESITQDKIGSADPEKLDKSSSNRLVLWRAAAVMIMEDPITGKGFKEFPRLKALYTEQPVKESDPHSMYLYIGSQMGLPALVLFLGILGYSFFLGTRLARHREDGFVRAIGIGGASATVCFAIICLFGSRAVNLEFTSYFWMYLVCMQVLHVSTKAELPGYIGQRKRSSAFDFAVDNNSGNEQGSALLQGQAKQALLEGQQLASRVRQSRKKRSGFLSGKPKEPGRQRGAAAMMAAESLGNSAPKNRHSVRHSTKIADSTPLVSEVRPMMSDAIEKRRRRQLRRR